MRILRNIIKKAAMTREQKEAAELVNHFYHKIPSVPSDQKEKALNSAKKAAMKVARKNRKYWQKVQEEISPNSSPPAFIKVAVFAIICMFLIKVGGQIR